MEVQGDYVYTANYLSQSLQVFDVSNHALPHEVACVKLTGQPTNLALDGTYALVVADDRRLTVVDISVPAAPTVRASVETVESPGGLYAATATRTSRALPNRSCRSFLSSAILSQRVAIELGMETGERT